MNHDSLTDDTLVGLAGCFGAGNSPAFYIHSFTKSIYTMKKQLFLCLSFALGLAGSSYAQFSAGVMAGAGYLWQRQGSSTPNSTFIGLDAAQPLLMGGVYGQYIPKVRQGIVAGLQLRYQSQRQSQRFTAMNPSNPFELTEAQYNRYSYLVATPYVGIRPFDKLEIAIGPEINFLLRSRLVLSAQSPAQWVTGYNIKATYWFSRLGFEGGYSYQNTAFDNLGGFKFYNRYAYGAIKYNLISSAR